MLNIGFLFHSVNSDNLGVGALTLSQIAILRSIARATGIELKFTIFDWKDARAPYVSGPDIEVIRLDGALLKSPLKMLNLLRRCDLVIDIGAGDSFADIYGSGRLNRMFWLKGLTHFARKPLVLSPQTFGPFTRPISRILARASINRSALVVARDEVSAQHLQQLGIKRSVITASDVALCLPAEGSVPNWSKVTIGLNVSGLLMAGGYHGDNQFGLREDYAHTMHRLIRRFQNMLEAPDIVLVPHVISASNEVEDDFRAAQRLQDEFPGLLVAPRFATPSEAKQFISSLDFFAGSRMHACIAAFSSGVPVVPLAYSRKFSGLFGALGYEETVDCMTASGDDIINAVCTGFARREMLKMQVSIARGVGEARLSDYVDALSRLISEVALGKQKNAPRPQNARQNFHVMDERL